MNQDLDYTLARLLAPARAAEPTALELRTVLDRSGRRRFRLRRGRSLAALLAALVVAGGAAAGLLGPDRNIDERVRNNGAFQSTGDPALDRLVAAARTHPDFAPLADTFSIEARVADPTGEPAWALVVWRTETAGWCAQAAREQAGRIGEIDAAGGFQPFPFHEGGVCTSGSLAPDGALFFSEFHAGRQAIVYGVAGRDVAAVSVTGIAGVGELTPSARGGFMAVVPWSEAGPPRPRAILRLRNGRTRAINARH
jgi:hypothetical protein